MIRHLVHNFYSSFLCHTKIKGRREPLREGREVNLQLTLTKVRENELRNLMMMTGRGMRSMKEMIVMLMCAS